MLTNKWGPTYIQFCLKYNQNVDFTIQFFFFISIYAYPINMFIAKLCLILGESYKISSHIMRSVQLGFSLTSPRPTQYTLNISITFIQRRPNLFDVGPTLIKCHTNVLCLLGIFHVVPAFDHHKTLHRFVIYDQ